MQNMKSHGLKDKIMIPSPILDVGWCSWSPSHAFDILHCTVSQACQVPAEGVREPMFPSSIEAWTSPVGCEKRNGRLTKSLSLEASRKTEEKQRGGVQVLNPSYNTTSKNKSSMISAAASKSKYSLQLLSHHPETSKYESYHIFVYLTSTSFSALHPGHVHRKWRKTQPDRWSKSQQKAIPLH